MTSQWRRFAPFGLYLSLLAALVALGFYIVQREWNLPVQISLAVVVLGLAAFALLDPDRARRVLTGRQARYGSNALVLSLAFIGILVVVNYLGYQQPKRWDLTEDKEHTLAKETLDTLEALPEPVTALAFYTQRMPSDSAQKLLEDYKYRGGGKFNYTFIDPEKDPVAARQAEIDRDGTIVLQMGDRVERVTYATEQELTAALIRLLNPQGRAIYFLTGHGERSLEDYDDQALSQLKQALERKNYTVRSLNLIALNSIPDDAQVIVIAGPQKPVTSEEVDLLQAFMESGGGLVVLEEPLPLTDFDRETDPLAEYLTQTWGLTLGDDLIVDLTSSQPFVAVANKYGDHVVTQKMQGLVTFFPTARSVSATESITGTSQVELVFTAPQSWAETDLQSLDESTTLTPDEGVDLLGPVPIAALAEQFTQQSKLVVFGDVDFATNAYFTAYGNGDLVVNALDWAAGQEDLINLTPKSRTTRLLIPPQRYLMGLIFLGVNFVVPGLALVAGIITWVQRRRRR